MPWKKNIIIYFCIYIFYSRSSYSSSHKYFAVVNQSSLFWWIKKSFHESTAGLRGCRAKSTPHVPIGRPLLKGKNINWILSQVLQQRINLMLFSLHTEIISFLCTTVMSLKSAFMYFSSFSQRHWLRRVLLTNLSSETQCFEAIPFHNEIY